MASIRCDRCGGLATRRYEQHRLSFHLCDTHADRHDAKLRADGWLVYRVVDVHAQPA